MLDLLFLTLLVCVGMGFSVLNGMNDISGLIAPLVATRGLPSGRAHLAAIVGIGLGIFLAHGAVAETVAVGLADLSGGAVPTPIALLAWLGGVSGALLWGIVARRLGIPTSATHAFIGALCGASLAATGQIGLIHWGFDAFFTSHTVEGVMKVVAGLILSPLIGSAIGYLLFHGVSRTFKRTSSAVQGWLRATGRLTLVLQAFCYGSNDAQNIMGALTGALMAWDGRPFHVPLWIRGINYLALSIGVVIGSAAIVRTVGGGLIHLTAAEATCGQLGEALAVLGAAQVGAPVSSSQVLSSALVGAGGAFRPRHVRWARVRQIVMTWVLTFPCALIFGGILTACTRFFLTEVIHVVSN